MTMSGPAHDAPWSKVITYAPAIDDRVSPMFHTRRSAVLFGQPVPYPDGRRS